MSKSVNGGPYIHIGYSYGPDDQRLVSGGGMWCVVWIGYGEVRSQRAILPGPVSCAFSAE